MAIERFWHNLKSAKQELEITDRVLVPGGESSRSFSLDLWLIPQTVEGFDPDDFWMRSKTDREALSHAVEQFRDVARRANDEARPVTPEEHEEARAAFQTIADLVELDRYVEAKDYRTAKILDMCREKLRRNQYPVSEIVHRIEDDSTGEKALWVWVILEDEATTGDRFFEITRQVRSDLTRMLRAYGVELWPFIHFRSRSEQDEVDGEHP